MSTHRRSVVERFKDFASGFHGRLFVSVIVYADETGHHDPTGQKPGSEICGVAGYVGWADNWAGLCGEWKTVLDRYGVAAFHFKEFNKKDDRVNNPKSPYYQWDDKKHAAFLHELSPIAKKWTLFGVVSLVSTRDYHRILSIKERAFFMHPYLLSLLPFYGEVLAQIEKRFLPLSDAKLTFVFDRANQFSQASIGIFNLMHRVGDPRNKMDTIAFASTIDHIELQAADLLAAAARQKSSALVLKGSQKLRPLDEELGLGTHVRLSCETRKSLQLKLNGLKAAGLDAETLNRQFNK